MNFTEYAPTLSPSDINRLGMISIFGYVPDASIALVTVLAYTLIVCFSLVRSFQVFKRGIGSNVCCGCCCCCFGPIWHYTSVVPIAALIELIGYGCRIDMTKGFGAWNYLFTTVSLLVAPVILAIMNYKVAGLLLSRYNLRVGCFSARSLSSISIFVDVVCALLQFGASVCSTISFAMGDEFIKKISDDALICSFVLQLALNIGFTVVVAWMYREPTFAPSTSSLPRVRSFWFALWGTIGLLWVRNIFRAVEAFAALAGLNAIGGEVLFYLLDTLPILLCFLIFNFSLWYLY